MKLAITGKGGVGKTTLAVLFAKHLAEKGESVVLIDADPDANAAMRLGLDGARQPQPISELKEIIAERTGAKGTGGELYRLNPRVDDIPERFAVNVDGVRLLRMGALARGGSGCFCPENAFLKNLLAHLLFGDEETVILDMEAGIEHLGRATAGAVDVMLAVVEPGQLSINTAFAVRKYAADIGLSRIGVLINKYRSQQELDAIAVRLGALPVLGRFPYDEAVASCDLAGTCPYTGSETQRALIEDALAAIEEFMRRPQVETDHVHVNSSGGTDA